MTIEQRLEDAQTDLRVMIGDGANVEHALEQVARHYELRPAILRARAEKAFGPLDTMKNAVRLERAFGAQDAALRAILIKECAALGFVKRTEPTPAFASSIEKEYGFSPTHPTGSIDGEMERAAFYEFVNEAFGQAFRDARSRKLNHEQSA